MSKVDKKKSLGQVFTPSWVVDTMLDELEYTGARTLSLSILEPSVGEGVFLQKAVRRILKTAKEHNLSDNEITRILENNVVGIDIDNEMVEICKHRLNEVLEEHDFIHTVKWNVEVKDALQYDPHEKFDLVVGNPPYISIHNMPAELRQSVKAFASSTGSTDLYVIFFELGIRLLKDTGKLGYITPNAWLKTIAQKTLRKQFLNNKYLSKIVDYGSYPVFGKDADTYTAIAYLSKQGSDTLTYEKALNSDTTVYSASNDYSEIVDYNGSPLVFTEKGLYVNKVGLTVKDVCVVQNGLCTLSNGVYLDYPADVEEELLHPVVKGTKYRGGDTDKYILFPYKESVPTKNQNLFSAKMETKSTATVSGITEEDLSHYPQAQAHFENNRELLESRNRDKSALWFHYGRSQGLKNANKPKLVLSMVLSPKADTVSAYKASDEVIVYGGFFITLKDSTLYSLDDIVDILASPEFFDYAWNSSKDMGGGYKSFSVRVVNEFIIPERFLKSV